MHATFDQLFFVAAAAWTAFAFWSARRHAFVPRHLKYPSRRGPSGKFDDEQEKCRACAVAGFNGRPYFARWFYRLVLTNKRLCVSYVFAAKDNWLFYFPLNEIVQADIVAIRDGVRCPYLVRFRLDNPLIQSIQFEMDYRERAQRWGEELTSVGVMVSEDLSFQAG